MKTEKKVLIRLRDKNTCAYCGKVCSLEEIHIDHITARFVGGTNELDNLTVSCSRCNAIKSTDTVEVFKTKIAQRRLKLLAVVNYYDSILKITPQEKL
jgi:5-methylcytosine-specific restriction endonuclease McrA